MIAHPLALTPIERAMLFANGKIQITDPSSRPAPREKPRSYLPAKTGRAAWKVPEDRRPRKSEGTFGKVKEIAIRAENGEFPNMTLPQIADAHGLNFDSLKAAAWKVRKEREQ